ncbi:MAG: M48 family metallopeptidase [Saprospiraceae bacterium]|nr:M48 family metallopeptidase [Saprospiraceae bacterium]
MHLQKFHIGGKIFILHITESQRQSGLIKLQKDDSLMLELPATGQYDRQKLIKDLLIKFSQNYFLPDIIKKVNHFNLKYFNKPINGVRLKYNKSNWGSCSTGKNLNFSVRLFFAPDDVIDYVVVHELAHLVEMNHSDRFWSIVENIIPDYPAKEKILKINNGKFDF